MNLIDRRREDKYNAWAFGRLQFAQTEYDKSPIRRYDAKTIQYRDDSEGRKQ
jgi:hypothetical protein